MRKLLGTFGIVIMLGVAAPAKADGYDDEIEYLVGLFDESSAAFNAFDAATGKAGLAKMLLDNKEDEVDGGEVIVRVRTKLLNDSLADLRTASDVLRLALATLKAYADMGAPDPNVFNALGAAVTNSTRILVAADGVVKDNAKASTDAANDYTAAKAELKTLIDAHAAAREESSAAWDYWIYSKSVFEYELWQFTSSLQ